MKNILLLVVLLFHIYPILLAQDYFYGPSGKIPLAISEEMIALKFTKETTKLSQKIILVQEPLLFSLEEFLTIPHPRLSLVALKRKVNTQDLEPLLETLRNKANILSAQPIYKYTDGTRQICTGKLFAKVKNQKNLKLLRKYMAEKHPAISFGIFASPLSFKLSLPVHKAHQALALSRILFETGWFEYVEPDFLKLIQPMHSEDPLAAVQWALNNDGENTRRYGGMAQSDMNVYSAWDRTTGSPAIKVAVLDEGIDLQHPDLAGNLLPGYDATGQGSSGGAAEGDAHGTACAGIIAAEGNNGIGIAGVAYGSKIVPIRIAYRAGSNWVTTNGWIAAAINWAWEQGQADILCNAWGGGSPSSLINETIDKALQFGRRGLGSPVVFAAGNRNGELNYPASYAPTIAVTAMSMCDERKSLTSCDEENWWGANYGVGVDVAAPGVKITTLDNTGTTGWSEEDYIMDFNGTSAACPNVAGVLALLLSFAPDLTAEEARFLLESSCDKVGDYTYSEFVPGQAAGAWSSELGYGRVNAGNALTAVSCEDCLSCLDGVMNGQETQIDCGGPACLPCPSCDDGIQNGDEEDVDCGGSECAPCTCYQSSITIDINFDHYPGETSWVIRTVEGVMVASDGPFPNIPGLANYTHGVDLPAGQYVFTINDSYGDGICCNYGDGSFSIQDANGNSILAGTEFTAALSASFCIRPTDNHCEDGIQNGDETEIDCGGTCGSCDDFSCVSEVINMTSFEENWGIWRGDLNVRRSFHDRGFANTGNWCVRLMTAPNGVGLYSSVLDLSMLAELSINFAFITADLAPMKDGFSFQISRDGGKTFTTAAKWQQGIDYENAKHSTESIQLSGPFSTATVLSFQVDGDSDRDKIYLDDIEVKGCQESDTTFTSINLQPQPESTVSQRLTNSTQFSSVSIYPNPNSGQLTIISNRSLAQFTHLQILNTQGKIVHKRNISVQQRKVPLELDKLPEGIYWMRLYNQKKITSTRFIIQR